MENRRTPNRYLRDYIEKQEDEQRKKIEKAQKILLEQDKLAEKQFRLEREQSKIERRALKLTEAVKVIAKSKLPKKTKMIEAAEEVLIRDREDKFKTSPGYAEMLLKSAKDFAMEILNSPGYKETLIRRAVAGVLPAAVECMLWYYSYGKPKDELKVSFDKNLEDLTQLSDAELAVRMAQMATQAAKIATEKPEEIAKEALGVEKPTTGMN